MKRLNPLFHYLTGKIYVPELAKQLTRPTLLHISDTPNSSFKALIQLIRLLQPDYIVHTGDLVDNIKLQLYPRAVPRYESTLKSLIGPLENSSATVIWLCMGNHDSEAVVSRYAKRSQLVRCSEKVTCHGRTIHMSHYAYEVLRDPAELNLFGHNLDAPAWSSESIFLNGVKHISLVSLETMTLCQMRYPIGTDEQRLGKGRIGY